MADSVLHITSPPLKGPRVLQLQKALKSNKYGTYYTGALDSIYDTMVAQAVHRAKYWLGYPKEHIDQRAGTKLFEILLAKRPLPLDYKVRRAARIAAAKRRSATPLRAKALATAESQVGYHEGANNNTKYGAWYGCNYAPWCAMFVSWCYAQHGSHFRYASVPYILYDARMGKNNLTITHDPKPGDLVLFNWDGGQPDHVGIFHSWVNSTTFTTVEGNTSDAVMRKTRYKSNVTAFVHVGA